MPGNKTTQPQTPANHVVIADDFTEEQIIQHRDAAIQHVVEAEAQWPGMVSLVGGERNGNLGKLIAQLDPALRGLFAALTPVPGEDAAKTASKKKLAAIFNAALGDQDHGKDPGVFEVELLVRRLSRIEAEQKIVDKLEAIRQVFADDILNTGAMVVEPGLKALGVARGIADSNPEFRSLLAPLTNALGDMTKAARQAQSEARAKAKRKATKADDKEEPPADDGEGKR